LSPSLNVLLRHIKFFQSPIRGFKSAVAAAVSQIKPGFAYVEVSPGQNRAYLANALLHPAGFLCYLA
jgi:hypothetical protein